MTSPLESQQEPPGAPRETPWPEPERRSPETPGEPRETPWPQEEENDGE